MGQKFACHKISEGKATSEALVSEDDIMFYLIRPVQADGLFQLNKNGNMPKAMIIQYPETVLVSSAIIMDIPMVDKVDPEFYKTVKDGDQVLVNADEGYVEIL